MLHVFHALCKTVDTPLSLGAWLRFKYGEHRQLAELELPIGSYTEKDHKALTGDYMVAEFLSKWKGLVTKVDTKAVALAKFIASEASCRATNDRLTLCRRWGSNPFVDSVIHTAQRKIAALLGPFSLLKIAPFFGWGPGATWDIPRRKAQVDQKIAAYPLTVSARNIGLGRSILEADRHWLAALLGSWPEGPVSLTRDSFQLVESCRVETVPKNAKTDRVIAIEPTLNLFIQKGYGGFLRSRLKRVGVDLDDQRPNQVLASKALTDGLATLDLRAASDTVSKELVFELLPIDWASALDDARSHFAEFEDGKKVKLEKFSSMGNGFTFELESLIFWALVGSVTDQVDLGAPFVVYGDDIICSKRASDRVVEVLAHCGFELNTKKSFRSGLFYESCGKHYFIDREVTPAYQKEELSNLSEAIHCYNRLYRWERRVGIPSGIARDALLRNHVRYTDFLKFQISDDQEGDDGFLVDTTTFVQGHSGRFSPSRGWEASVLTAKLMTLPGHESALLAHYFRINDGISHAPDVEACKGDVEVIVLGEDRKVVTVVGHRWIIPSGVCPLPLR